LFVAPNAHSTLVITRTCKFDNFAPFSSRPEAPPELELAYLPARWPELQLHIRQAIMTLVHCIDSTAEVRPE
jgi:hypothetical protein